MDRVKFIHPIWDSVTIASIHEPLWDFEYLKLPKLWADFGVEGEGVNVYVIDTGMPEHHAFKHTPHKMYSFINDKNPIDGNGHGSWCCGKISANGVGIAPKCNMTSLKGLDDEGMGYNTWINNALKFVLKEPNPHIVNMSLGGYRRDPYQEKIIDELYKKGVIVVAAAGNEDTDELSYPAAYDSALAVAAMDSRRERANFSNYGKHIVVSAPGVSCYSTYKKDYRKLAGTSMAAPTVAGLLTLGASLLLKKYPGINTVVLRDHLTKAITDTAIDLGDKGKDQYYGFGGINAEEFMKKLTEI